MKAMRDAVSALASAETSSAKKMRLEAPDVVLVDGNRRPWGNPAGKTAKGGIRCDENSEFCIKNEKLCIEKREIVYLKMMNFAGPQIPRRQMVSSTACEHSPPTPYDFEGCL